MTRQLVVRIGFRSKVSVCFVIELNIAQNTFCVPFGVGMCELVFQILRASISDSVITYQKISIYFLWGKGNRDHFHEHDNVQKHRVVKV